MNAFFYYISRPPILELRNFYIRTDCILFEGAENIWLQMDVKKLLNIFLLLTYLLTYLLTPWSSVLLEKLTSNLCS
jgi:hypothetical protein